MNLGGPGGASRLQPVAGARKAEGVAGAVFEAADGAEAESVEGLSAREGAGLGIWMAGGRRRQVRSPALEPGLQ